MAFIGETYHNDKAGNRIPKSRILELAFGNIESSMSKKDLVEAYIENLTTDELIEWATNSDGIWSDDNE